MPESTVVSKFSFVPHVRSRYIKADPHFIRDSSRQLKYLPFNNTYRTDIVDKSYARDPIHLETSTNAVHRRKQFRCLHSFALQFESLKWKTIRGPSMSVRPISSSYISSGFIGMSTKNATDSPLANVTSEIEERRCDLIGRHRELRNKVATMERSIPALMAYNMWMAERDCRDGSYDKVREIVNKFSPQPDPADRLLAELKSTVDGLHQETTQLHVRHD